MSSTLRQLARFIGSNSIAAVMNIVAKTISASTLGDPASIFVGFCTGLVTSYALCRKYVFKPRGSANFSEVIRFTMINCASLALTFATYHLALALIHVSIGAEVGNASSKVMAYTLGVIAPIAFSFAAQRAFTFRQP
mgnify:CR=1 FL=1